MEKFSLDCSGVRREKRGGMDAHSGSALLSAAAYLCSAADDLRGAGFGAFAEEIIQLIDTLDAEILLSDDQT